MPAEAIRESAHAFARADRAMICWTLGITEHHTAVDNVLSLINLALLCGHVGRYGSGLNPLRGQNNVQGGGDMGAIPNKLPGFQDIERDDEARARFEAAWGVPIQPRYGWHLTQMFEAMEPRRAAHAVRDRREPGPVGGRHLAHAQAARGARLPDRAGHRLHEDGRATPTSCFPSSASWCEAEGTVTNSERRVQRVRKALEPPGQARDDTWILSELARRLGFDWGQPTAEQAWDELRSLSPMHRGMRYDRLEALGGIQWPCPDEDHPGSPLLHERLWAEPREGPPAPFSVVEHRPPFESLDDEYPMRLTTGRRLESYNTGAQTNLYSSPLHRRRGALPVARGRRADAARGGRDRPRVLAPRLGRGARAHRRRRCGRGSCFMTFHFPDQVDTNLLTIDATDPEVGHGRVQGGRRARREDPRRSTRQPRSSRARARGDRLSLDLHLLDAEATLPERAAVDGVLGAPRQRLGGRRAAPVRRGPHAPSAGTRRARSGTCCCRPCTRCRSTSAGSARAA